MFNGPHIPESENSFSVDRSLLLIRNDVSFGVGAHFVAIFQTHLHRKRVVENLSDTTKSVWKEISQIKEETID